MHPILNTDSYSISSNGFVPPNAQQYSCYNFTNRRSSRVAYPEVARDSRMVLFGVRHFIETYMTQRITVQHVREAELFLNSFHSFGGPIYFPKDLWMRVANECGGYLPVTIKSLRDGSIFFPYEPVIQVEGRDGFGELAAHIEARLVGAISNATAAATLCRHWRTRIEEEVAKDLKLLGRGFGQDSLDYYAQWMVHNFGSRACVTGEESRLIGMAHLLSFFGTDNLDAAYEARKQGAVPPHASSVMALAHRNVQSWDNEELAFKHIAACESRRKGFKIVSCVADCYDYEIGMSRVAELARQNPDVVFVARPDSGDGRSQLLQTCMKAKELELVKEENGCYLPTNFRFIYGDSVSPTYMFEVMEELRSNGFPPTQWGIFGVGGYIVNNSTRDTLSSSFKLASTANGPRVKLSNTPAKMSVPYTTMMRTTESPTRVFISGEDERETVYDNGLINVNWNFEETYLKSNSDFHTFIPSTPDWGLQGETLCKEIQDFRSSEYRSRGPRSNPSMAK